MALHFTYVGIMSESCTRRAGLKLSSESNQRFPDFFRGGVASPWKLRRSLRPPLFGFPQRNQIRHFPKPIRNASGYSGTRAQRPVNQDEVVREVAERY